MPSGVQTLMATVTRIRKNMVGYDFRMDCGTKRKGSFEGYDSGDFCKIGNYKNKPVYSCGFSTACTALEEWKQQEQELKAWREQEKRQEAEEKKFREELELIAKLRKRKKDTAIRLFKADYLSADREILSELDENFTQHDYEELKESFVKEWINNQLGLETDPEQTKAIAVQNSHLLVSARAGSGKTRTLVARTLFQIKHCRIPASSTLILAFNKEAVNEIRERLSKFLTEEQMPHVLTFHALAYRIVRPDETLIYDEGETKEGQVFSATIQRVIDAELRGGTLEEELRLLMNARWDADLDRIVQTGFDLGKDQFLKFRNKLPRVTIDGRRVKTEVHKQIGNTLLRHRIRYSYRKPIYRYSGAAYAPEFSHFNKDNDSQIIIEVVKHGSIDPNPAREAFWRSDRASNSLLIQIPEEATSDEQETSRCLVDGLRAHGVPLNPMSADELWKEVRERAIDNFTKTVKGFISRCQKELISPESLVGLIDNLSGRCLEIQERFWRLCGKIYSRYLAVLIEDKKTDFDQLMLSAAKMIQSGQTRFTSSRGTGNLASIKHLLIDEFQDFSHLFNELRKSFIQQSPDALFFCVGDDWQAINKFAGSDLRYFTGFQESFDPCVKKLISRNYRSFRKIVETGNQVMTDEGPPSIPSKTEEGKVLLVQLNGTVTYTEPEEIVVEELGDQAVPLLRIASDSASRGHDVAILSRTSSISTPEGMLKIESLEKKLRQFLPEEHRKKLHVSTTHGYKGQESDVVILLAPESYPLLHPDAIFSTIFGDTLTSIITDEKRLFYVGMTRARSVLYLLPTQASLEDKIPFLSHSNLSSFNINQLTARLVCGAKVIVRLRNAPGFQTSGGTYPLRDRLKGEKYRWNDETKIWSLMLDPGSIRSPFECIQYLQRQPWITDADGVVATFAWEDQQHQFRIDGGIPKAAGTAPSTPGGSAQTAPTHELTKADTHHTNVAGVTYENRAPAIRNLGIGDEVLLKRRPQNPVDKNAIEVMALDLRSLGYIPAALASRLAQHFDKLGGELPAHVTAMNPGLSGSYLSLSIEFQLPHTSPPTLSNKSQQPPLPPTSQAGPTPIPTPTASVHGNLTTAQEAELGLLDDPRLKAVINELYLSGACTWPEIGYEGKDASGHCTDSMLEVAWQDCKIGIALASNDVRSFIATGWTILPASSVSAPLLRSVLTNASAQAYSTDATPPSAPPRPPSVRPGPYADDDLPF